MRPLQRRGMSKKHGARKFRKHAAKTKSANVMPNPMRGGIRL